MSKLSLHIGTQRPIPVQDFADASRAYEFVRNAIGFTMRSRLAVGRVMDGDRHVATVSYNGRVWPPEPWHADMLPLFDNRTMGIAA